MTYAQYYPFTEMSVIFLEFYQASKFNQPTEPFFNSTTTE